MCENLQKYMSMDAMNSGGALPLLSEQPKKLKLKPVSTKLDEFPKIQHTHVNVMIPS